MQPPQLLAEPRPILGMSSGHRIDPRYQRVRCVLGERPHERDPLVARRRSIVTPRQNRPCDDPVPHRLRRALAERRHHRLCRVAQQQHPPAAAVRSIGMVADRAQRRSSNNRSIAPSIQATAGQGAADAGVNSATCAARVLASCPVNG